MKKMVTIIAPMYNEEALVKAYCQETIRIMNAISDCYDFEILFIDDGSLDTTLIEMQQIQLKYPKNISIISLTRNFGLEGAISAGLRYAKGDVIVVMDADLQDPPSLILAMIPQYEKGFDIVNAKRIRRESDTFFKKISARAFYSMLSISSDRIHCESGVANYCLLSRKALDCLLSLQEVNGSFRVQVPYLGMNHITISYDRDKRYAGSTKYHLKSMIRYGLDSITGLSIEPLRKIVWVFLPTFIIFFASLIGFFSSSNALKFASLIIFIMSVFFFVLYALLFIVGEYIGQIMIEVKHRPSAIVYQYLPAGLTREK